MCFYYDLLHQIHDLIWRVVEPLKHKEKERVKVYVLFSEKKLLFDLFPMIRSFLSYFLFTEPKKSSRNLVLSKRYFFGVRILQLFMTIILSWVYSTTGVNFNNVLRARFSYKILAPKITKLCFGFETGKKLPKRLSYEKHARKT